MKKILLSLGMIAVVAGVVWGVTGAFYNDTETSQGNIFVAGSVDLKVDHTKQTYNGVDCKTCDVTVVSDTSNLVIERNGIPVATSTAFQVTPTSVTNQYWTASSSPELAGSQWIWATDPVQVEDDDFDTVYTFRKDFVWMGPVSGATIAFAVAADNSYEVYLNGNLVNADTAENNHSSVDVISVNVNPSWINQGNNILTFKVKNWAQPGGDILNNPGGLRYVFNIDGDCGDAYFQNHCKLWTEKDLQTGDTFFSFNDVKPGDFGTNVISLHVYDNDAYACLIVHDKDDQENGIQDPESKYGDQPNVGNLNGFGELSNYLDVFTWVDTNQNGVFDLGEAPLLGSPSSLSSFGSLANLDSSSSYLSATSTKYVGLAWCAGNLTVDSVNGGVTCDGSGMKNDAQSDSFTASLTAYAEQTRNNDGFSCTNIATDFSVKPVLQP